MFGGLSKKLRKLKPSMSQYLNLLAALIPLMATFAVQAAGAAAALGGVAAAGAAVMGLGLLGHANSMTGAFQQAKLQVQELKGELFDTFQPTMQQFAPIQSQFFDYAPDRLNDVAEAMEGLTAYEDTFYNIFDVAAGVAEDLVKVLVQNEGIIGEMATEAMRIIGTGLVDFLRWLIQTAYENWQVMTQLGQAFLNFATIGYNVAMVVARIVAALNPLFAVIAQITQWLNSPLIVGILTAVATFTILVGTVWKLTTALYAALGALTAFGSGGIISGIVGGISFLVGKLWGLITTMWSAIFTSQLLIATLSALTLGAFAVGAGIAGMGAMSAMQSSGPSGGGRGMGRGGKTVVYNDNRQYSYEGGSDDYASQQSAFDQFEEWDGTQTDMDPPSPGTSTESSTSGSDNGGDNNG
jgi:hypothetical protein